MQLVDVELREKDRETSLNGDIQRYKSLANLKINLSRLLFQTWNISMLDIIKIFSVILLGFQTLWGKQSLIYVCVDHQKVFMMAII